MAPSQVSKNVRSAIISSVEHAAGRLYCAILYSK